MSTTAETTSPSTGPIWGTGRRKTAVARVPASPRAPARSRSTAWASTTTSPRKSSAATSRAPAHGHRDGPAAWTCSSTSPAAARARSPGARLPGDRPGPEGLPAPTWSPALRAGDFLTRDPRMVERKKYGHKKGPSQLPVLEALIDGPTSSRLAFTNRPPRIFPGQGGFFVNSSRDWMAQVGGGAGGMHWEVPRDGTGPLSLQSDDGSGREEFVDRPAGDDADGAVQLVAKLGVIGDAEGAVDGGGEVGGGEGLGGGVGPGRVGGGRCTGPRGPRRRRRRPRRPCGQWSAAGLGLAGLDPSAWACARTRR
jgi:hypothetical protein